MGKIRPGKFLLTALTSFSLISSLFIPSLAFAYSGYGVGTQSNPFLISSCQQLQEMDQNLSGYYVLVSNIDCTGIGFATIATASAFSGTLDGQNHTILNLNIVSYGSMIAIVNSATIKNINLKGGTSTCVSYCGSLVGEATDSILSNLHSSMTVTGAGVYSGGLVGSMRGSTSLSQSSFSGAFTGDAYSAGLVGVMWDAGTSVNDSFVMGTIHAIQSYVGTIVGGFFNGTISNTFSSATLDAGGNYYDAGLVGDSQGTINNSFSATTIYNQGGYDNGLVGIDPSGTYTNNFIDAESNNTTNCGNKSGECTVVNNGNSDPGYFKNNTSNGPFSSWDFTNIWQQNESYPVLKNEAAFVDPAAPNNGDANNDGIPDSYQANVANIQASDGTWSTMVVPADSGCVIRVLASIDRSTLPIDTGFTPLTQLDAFTLSCISTGDTFPVTMIFDKVYTNPIMRLYDGTLNAYHSFSSGSQPVFSTVTIGGIAKTKITYNINEGASIGSIGSQKNWSGEARGLSTQVIAPNTGFGVLKNNSAETIAEYVTAAFALLVVAEVIRRYTR